MAEKSHFYIPSRLYKRLKCIYKERIIIISAPEGYGKSGTIREFVRRSRPDGISCRFITEPSNANDCFAKICRILLGHEESIPTTVSDFNRLCRIFSAASPKKQLLVVLDCPAAADMLLGNLYCTRLFMKYSPIYITLITNELSYFNRMLADSYSITMITEKELALTLDEATEFFNRAQTDTSDIANICQNTLGQLTRLRLCQILVKRNEPIVSYDTTELIDNALIRSLDRSQQFAALCAVALDKLDDVTLAQLNSDPSLVDYFGKSAMTRSEIFSSIRHIRDIIPVIYFNERTHSWRTHDLFIRAAYRAFLRFPKEIQNALYICSAKEHERHGRTFRAFCQFYLAGDVMSAAMIPSDERVSFDLLMRSKDFMLKFVSECPLDCKPIIPRLLRLLGLLMLTQYRDNIKYRFDEIIAYISRSPDYTKRERQNMLCYAYAISAYEHFYFIEMMGTKIKLAYELYSGSSIGQPPFYTWALYTPSVFSLIHRYDIPISTEAEQFSRYHSMYTEILHHGEHVVSLYNAEVYYYTGNPEDALIRAQDVVEKCERELYLPTKIAALTALGKSALLLGYYDLFMNALNELADIKKRYSTTELSEMVALCLARLCCMRMGTDEDIWEISSKRDEDVLLNRYTAPFYFNVRCYAMLAHREYRMLINKRDYYVQAANDVRNETMILCYNMTAAVAYLTLGESSHALKLLTETMETLNDSGVIMPAAEICMHHPQLFEFALQNLPKKHHKFLTRVMELGKQYRRNMEAVRTKELTETGAANIYADNCIALIDKLLTEKEPLRRELGITASAMRYALCAAHGHSNEETAEICGTSVDSVKSSLKRTYAKLGIRSRSQLKYILEV